MRTVGSCPCDLPQTSCIAWLSRESSSMRTVGATSLQREVAEASQQAVMPSMRDLMMMDDQRMRLKWSRRRHGCGLVYPFQPSIRMRARYNRGLRGLGRRGLRPSPGVMVRDSARKSSMPEMIRSRQGGGCPGKAAIRRRSRTRPCNLIVEERSLHAQIGQRGGAAYEVEAVH